MQEPFGAVCAALDRNYRLSANNIAHPVATNIRYANEFICIAANVSK